MSKQTDYGIVIMARMASAPERELFTARDLAEAVQVTLPMVSKTLKSLARAGLLVSQRGVKGGYSLARDARHISVGSIIRALEGPVAITRCCDPSPPDCEHQPFCALPHHWDRINRALWQALEAIPLAEMAQPVSSGRLAGLGERGIALSVIGSASVAARPSAPEPSGGA